MKNPPTLADACIASLFDKRVMGNPRGQRFAALRPLFEQVLQARKFVLDRNMSRYLADLSNSFWHGGQRKRFALVENARRMARAPHALTWIELCFPDYLERAESAHGVRLVDVHGKLIERSDSGYVVARIGYLIRQHPKIETAFLATEFHSSTLFEDRAGIKPMSLAWCSDDTPSPFARLTDMGDEEAALVTRMTGYRSPFTHYVGNYPDPYMSRMVTNAKDFADSSNSIPMRDLWALLATINDLPILVEHVEPSKGYVARGRYRRFLDHTVLHLTVPESRWRKLVLKTAAILRRRAHQVRGHWRKDYRHPLSALCTHDFDEQMVCRRCHGRQLWIAEHQRGDASLGFVTHDYEVHHQKVTQ